MRGAPARSFRPWASVRVDKYNVEGDNRGIYKGPATQEDKVEKGKRKKKKTKDNSIHLHKYFYLPPYFYTHTLDASLIPAMSVFTVVHRALHWKRQTIKAKSPDQDLSEKTPDATDPSTHRDVQIAVKPVHPQPAGIPAPDSDSSPARSGSVHARKRAQLVRAVSWASIVRSESRWTAEQESELVRAQRQLGKCQKAWSSEQEVWLSYVCGVFFPCCAICIVCQSQYHYSKPPMVDSRNWSDVAGRCRRSVRKRKPGVGSSLCDTGSRMRNSISSVRRGSDGDLRRNSNLLSRLRIDWANCACRGMDVQGSGWAWDRRWS